MNYERFRMAWHQALAAAELLALGLPPTETVDVPAQSRAYHIVLASRSRPEVGPFHVVARLGWRWDAVLAARMATTEEDLLMELFGEGGYYLNTEPPWLRADVTLRATLPLEDPIPLPRIEFRRRWVTAVSNWVAPLLPNVGERNEDGLLIAHAWRGEPEAQVRCAPSGHLLLTGVELSAWQAIELPRQWDHPDREPDADPGAQLNEFLSRVRQALEQWEGCLAYLAPTSDTAR